MTASGSEPPNLATISTVPPPALDELPRGATLDRYVILRRLGRGGMGIVYLAFDGELERRVALKVLRPETVEGGSAGETRARLLREAQAMAKVSHPNVVAVFEVGTFGAEVFLAMEYVDGRTMRAWCRGARSKPRSLREIVAAYVQAGRGLAAAHAEGILHRDFKPENVVVDDHGRVKVLDFGLARLEVTGASEGRVASESQIALEDTGVHSRDALATPLTNVGEILGTPAYMAPEQLLGRGITARSDQYSFCLALYEALYGKLPFGGETVAQRAAAMLADRLQPAPNDARVPARLRRVLLRGLRANEAERFESMTELAGALETAVAPRTRPLAAVAVAAALLVGAIVVATRPSPARPCRGADETIATAWSGARAEGVRRAFDASGNPRAAESFVHARALLDRYAASWVATSTEACEATRVRGVQSDEGLDLRTACLQQRRKELAATVDLFTRADAKLVDDAVLAAARLTPVDACADVASLRAPFAPPRDDAQRRAIEALRGELAEVDALYRSARYEEASPLTDGLVARATSAEYGPLLAEALFWRGRVEFGLDRPEATATLASAALEAEAARNDVIAAEAWIRAFQIAADRAQREDAVRYGRLADAAVRRLRGNDFVRIHYLHAAAFEAFQREAQLESLSFAKQEVVLAEKTLEPTHIDRFIARSDLADALWAGGDVEGALAIYRDVQRSNTAILGDTHTNTLRSLSDVGAALIELGDYAGAVATLEPFRAMSLTRRPTVVSIGRVYLAGALAGKGEIADAIALFDATERLVRERDAGGEAQASDAADFARILVQRGANREAESYASRSIALASKGDAAVDRSEAYGVRALCKARRGDATGALEDAKTALTKVETLARKDLVPLLARGEALVALGRRAEGIAELERAQALADAKTGDLAIRADLRATLARSRSAP